MTSDTPIVSRGCSGSGLVDARFVPDGVRAVFFDRDGVLNIDRGYVSRIEDFEWVDGAREAVSAVRRAGWLAVIVTNQSGIGRGFYSEEDFLVLTSWMLGDIDVDGVYYCPHHPDEECVGRKPRTGMIAAAQRDFKMDLSRSVLVGDKETDMEAAKAAGMRGLRFLGGDLYRFLEGHGVMG